MQKGAVPQVNGTRGTAFLVLLLETVDKFAKLSPSFLNELQMKSWTSMSWRRTAASIIYGMVEARPQNLSPMPYRLRFTLAANQMVPTQSHASELFCKSAALRRELSRGAGNCPERDTAVRVSPGAHPRPLR